MPSEMVREAIQMAGNTHCLAKGPWALGGHDDTWTSLDTDAGVNSSGEIAARGSVNRTTAG